MKSTPSELPALEDLNISIYECENLKSLVEIYVKKGKEVDSRISLRYLSRNVLGNNPGYLQDIFSKKVSISHRNQEKLILLFGIEDDQSLEYFLIINKMWELEKKSDRFYPIGIASIFWKKRLSDLKTQSRQVNIEELQKKCLNSFYHQLILHIITSTKNPNKKRIKELLHPAVNINERDLYNIN